MTETGTGCRCGRLPPWGGSGLKSWSFLPHRDVRASPSLGREWIEIDEIDVLELLISVSLLGEGVD